MNEAKIVICTGAGDSGKGVVVDNLCDANSLVIRFSGGHNAGHTVIRDNIKHVFSSYGSGTLKGCSTYLTEDTVLYLPAIIKERDLLKEKGIIPKLLSINPLAMVTTPYDIIYNRIMEKKNGHGSVGVGVAATMKRNIETPYKLYAVDLLCEKVLIQKLIGIRDYYLDKLNITRGAGIYDSLIQLGGRDLVDEYFDLEDLFHESLDKIFHYDEDDIFQIANFEAIKDEYTNYVFEGSQGILLDMDHGFFPNVTYANTTSKNALKYCQKYDLDPEIFYVTRCYQTRHGNGYMSREQPITLINNEEEINVLNEYQGQFRIGEFDLDLFKYAIQVDYAYHYKDIPMNCVITCMDQRNELDMWREVVMPILDLEVFNKLYLNNSAKCDNMEEQL